MRIPGGKRQQEDIEDVPSSRGIDLKRRKPSRDSLNEDEGEETELIKFSMKKHGGTLKQRRSKDSRLSKGGSEGENEEQDSKCVVSQRMCYL